MLELDFIQLRRFDWPRNTWTELVGRHSAWAEADIQTPMNTDSPSDEFWQRFHSDIWSQLQQDPISTEHLDNQSDPKWTLNPDGLLHHLGCIYVLNSGNLQLCVLQYLHDHPLAGHFSQTKTLHQVCMQYYWSVLPVYVKDYWKSCTTCSYAKPVCHKPYRLLKQLPIPKKPWNSISKDFMEKLPPSSSYTSILVIVDHL